MKIFDFFKDGVDCALIMSEKNRFYVTKFKSSDGAVLCFKEKIYLLADFRYYEKAAAQSNTYDVIRLTNLFEQLNDLLKKHKAKKIAVESKYMTISELNKFKEKLYDYELDTSDYLSDCLENMRMIKTSEEIKYISCAQSIAEKAYLHILNYIRPGRTESEIALELDYFMLKNGAEGTSFDTIVLSGRNTSVPHGASGIKEVKNGEFVLMDFGAVVGGYRSDMTRTVCVGTPSEEMESIYNTVLEANESALAELKPGVYARQLDKIARDIINNAGYEREFGHSLGHGVGLEVHEMPRVSGESEHILKENTVITIEPGIYIPNKFGVRIEDLIVVTSNGYKNFNNTNKKLEQL